MADVPVEQVFIREVVVALAVSRRMQTPEGTSAFSTYSRSNEWLISCMRQYAATEQSISTTTDNTAGTTRTTSYY